MLRGPTDPPLPDGDYNRVMAKLRADFDMLSEGAPINTQYTRNLLSNLNPRVNPGSQADFFRGLDGLIDGS